MLEQLFGSKTRVRLLRLFLNNPKGAFFVRELSRRISAQINAIRNELENLADMGLISVVTDVDSAEEDRGLVRTRRSAQQRKYYRLNADSLLYPEMRALFMKSQVMLEKDFVKKLQSAGNISYLALTGFFVSEEPSSTDMLIVGKLNQDKLTRVIKDFERTIGREVNYTVFTTQEFRYRRDVTDRFLFSILESRKLVAIDTISERVGQVA